MTTPRVPLSVLDLATVSDGSTSRDALAATTALARRADELGYVRFWVAEHHSMPAVASTAPAVLIAHLAAHTGRIRIGSGGVMLPNHPALVVGEQFAMLEALYPDRIDLGIGRAPGADPVTAAALRRSATGDPVEQFPVDLIDTLALLGRPAPGRALSAVAQRLRATPAAISSPPVWLLGSSTYSARLAGELGLPFAYAHHFSTGQTDAAVATYRESFRPSEALASSRLVLTTSVLVASTVAEARYLAGPSRVMALSLRTGRLGPVVSPDDAAAALAELERTAPAQLSALLADLPGTQVVGTVTDAVAALEALVDRTGADELMITGTAYDVQTRIDTLERLAAGWGLHAPDAGERGSAAGSAQVSG